MALLSGDPALRHVLTSPATDVFMSIAGYLRHKPPEAVTSRDRTDTKRIVYGLLYGMAIPTMSAALGVPIHTVRTVVSAFHAAFPRVREFTERVVRECRASGFVTTIAGRRRYLPALRTGPPTAAAAAARQAISTVVQGSAADVVKAAFVELDQRCLAWDTDATTQDTDSHTCPHTHVLPNEDTHSTDSGGYKTSTCGTEVGGYPHPHCVPSSTSTQTSPPTCPIACTSTHSVRPVPILQLHDEIVLLVPARHVEATARMTRTVMMRPALLDLVRPGWDAGMGPLPVSLRIGPTLHDLKAVAE